jgi:hypothetical protein
MTTEERLAYADDIEHRALSVLANAIAFLQHRRYEPDFVMFPDIGSMPHPADAKRARPHPYFAGILCGIAGAAAIAVVLTLVKT